eukprot:gene58066-biopygen6879
MFRALAELCQPSEYVIGYIFDAFLQRPPSRRAAPPRRGSHAAIVGRPAAAPCCGARPPPPQRYQTTCYKKEREVCAFHFPSAVPRASAALHPLRSVGLYGVRVRLQLRAGWIVVVGDPRCRLLAALPPQPHLSLLSPLCAAMGAAVRWAAACGAERRPPAPLLRPLLWSLWSVLSLLGAAAAAPQIARIPSGETGRFKWRGAAAVGDDVIFCPSKSAHVLSLDAAAGTTRRIPHNEETGEYVNNNNWDGAVAVGGVVYNSLLYCVPYDHAALLSVDVATGRTAVVPVDLGVTGDWKWSGGAAVGATLCLCPYNADVVVLYDTVSGDTALIGAGERGNAKWRGAAAHGARAYCTPHNSDNVLSVDPAGRATDLIATGPMDFIDWANGVTGYAKWAGDGAVVGDEVYFAPFVNDHVLVLLLGGARPSVRLVDTGRTGYHKWAGAAATARKFRASLLKSLAAALGHDVYFAPSHSPDVLVVDTRTRAVSFVATGDTAEYKWYGAAVVGTTVFVAPYSADNVLSVTTAAAPTVQPTAAPTTASCAAAYLLIAPAIL